MRRAAVPLCLLPAVDPALARHVGSAGRLLGPGQSAAEHAAEPVDRQRGRAAAAATEAAADPVLEARQPSAGVGVAAVHVRQWMGRDGVLEGSLGLC